MEDKIQKACEAINSLEEHEIETVIDILFDNNALFLKLAKQAMELLKTEC